VTPVYSLLPPLINILNRDALILRWFIYISRIVTPYLLLKDSFFINQTNAGLLIYIPDRDMFTGWPSRHASVYIVKGRQTI